MGAELRTRGWQEPNPPGSPEMTLELRVPLQLWGLLGSGSNPPLSPWAAENLQMHVQFLTLWGFAEREHREFHPIAPHWPAVLCGQEGGELGRATRAGQRFFLPYLIWRRPKGSSVSALADVHHCCGCHRLTQGLCPGPPARAS